MINRLFSDIYSNIGSNIQDTSSAMQTIIKRYCNDAYFEILRRINWNSLDIDYTLAVTAGTRDYVLPNNFGKESYVYDSTNLKYLSFISFQELVDAYSDSLNSSGTVGRYTVFQDVVRNQPSSASALSIVSSSASDSTQTIRIKGTDSNDVEIDESVTLSGTTPVASTNSYKEIRSITKSASTVGRVTITSNSGAVTNAIMSLADTDYKVKKIRLHYTPSSALTLSIPYHVDPYPLFNDNDVPIIDCAEGIELGGTARAWRYKRQFQKAQEFERLFEKWMVDAIWQQENQPNQTKMLNPRPYDRDDI